MSLHTLANPLSHTCWIPYPESYLNYPLNESTGLPCGGHVPKFMNFNSQSENWLSRFAMYLSEDKGPGPPKVQLSKSRIVMAECIVGRHLEIAFIQYLQHHVLMKPIKTNNVSAHMRMKKDL
jgi:hypothetical protein